MTSNQTDLFDPGPDSGSDLTSWRKLHRVAVTDYRAGRGRRAERAVLAYFDGVDAYIGASGGGFDPFTCEHVAGPMIAAAGAMLDLDLGRLDAGTLSALVSTFYERSGIDPDSHERYGYALRRDGATLSRHARESEALAELHRICPASWHHATEFEGFSVVSL